MAVVVEDVAVVVDDVGSLDVGSLEVVVGVSVAVADGVAGSVVDVAPAVSVVGSTVSVSVTSVLAAVSATWVAGESPPPEAPVTAARLLLVDVLGSPTA